MSPDSRPVLTHGLDWGLAGELGFEPRFSESESDVLPLNYSPAGQEAIVLHRQPGGRVSHGAISLI